MIWILMSALTGCSVAHAENAVPEVEAPSSYDTSLLQLATGFAAKEACSCLFVQGRDEDDCKAYIKVSPDVARIKVDHDERVVTSKVLGVFAKNTAHWESEQLGCVLDP